MPPFEDHTLDTAPDESRPALAGAKAKFGFVPSALARMAESPTAVAAFGKTMATFEASSLAHVEREVIAMTTASIVGCHVCVALHGAILAANPETAPLAAPLREGRSLDDPRLGALQRFTRAVIATRGDVAPEDLSAFLAAGYTKRAALDVVVGVALYTFTAYTNRLTRAPIDPAFA